MSGAQPEYVKAAMRGLTPKQKQMVVDGCLHELRRWAEAEAGRADNAILARNAYREAAEAAEAALTLARSQIAEMGEALGSADQQLGNMIFNLDQGLEQTVGRERVLSGLRNVAVVTGLALRSSVVTGGLKSIRSREDAPLLEDPMPKGWRTDLENAPKDGRTEFIAYRPDAGVFAAIWQYPPHEDGGMDDSEPPTLFAAGGEDLTREPPTAWMPLPAEPSPAGDKLANAEGEG